VKRNKKLIITFLLVTVFAVVGLYFYGLLYCPKCFKILKSGGEWAKSLVEKPSLLSRGEVFSEKDKLTWREVEKKSKNAVVQVFVEEAEFNWTQPYITPEQTKVTGSGFIINEEGYLITNSHVVISAKSIWLQMPDLGRVDIEAESIGICPDVDVALLKIKESGLKLIKNKLKKVPFLSMGNSDLVRRADSILSFGYPLGQYYLKNTIGVISGLEHVNGQMYFQIDAAINPGSSGGPLLNEQGEVIGIVTAAIPTAENVGYIIPINDLKIILDNLHETKFFRKQKLGFFYNYTTSEQASYLKNPVPGGIYLNEILKNSILDRAGIKEGDMLYEIGGYKLDKFGEANVPWSSDKVRVSDIMARFKVNDKTDLILYRKGEKIACTVTFADAPVYPIREIYPECEKVDYEMIGGMVVADLVSNLITSLVEKNKYLVEYRKPENKVKLRLVITHIFPGSKIYQSEALAAGDVIKEVNEIPVNTLKQYRQALQKSLDSGVLTIKTEDYIFVVFSFKKILKDELRLSKSYDYSTTPTVTKLLEQNKIILNRSHLNRIILNKKN